MFLDEITSVEEWRRGMKRLVDAGMLPNCTVVAAGSGAPGTARAAERLPGRRGRVEGAHDHVLLPMRFAEFAALRDGEFGAFARGLRERGTAEEVRAQLPRGEIPEEARDIDRAGLGRLDAILREYLLVGGILRIVDKRIRDNFIPKVAYAAQLESIAGDWGRKGAERPLSRAGGALVSRLGSGTTWNGLRRDAEFSSWTSARDCATFLEDTSIITVVRRYGKKGAPRILKEKKIYFRDPFYAHVFNSWTDGTRDPFELSEMLLADDAGIGAVVEGGGGQSPRAGRARDRRQQADVRLREPRHVLEGRQGPGGGLCAARGGSGHPRGGEVQEQRQARRARRARQLFGLGGGGAGRGGAGRGGAGRGGAGRGGAGRGGAGRGGAWSYQGARSSG